MRTTLRSALTIFIVSAWGGVAWAQFRIPPIRIPVRVPVHVPIHIPLHIPHSVPAAGNGNGAQAGQDDSMLWVIGGGLGAVAAAGAGGYWYWRSQVVRIRIVSTPTGDAPEEVRRAWVGLELPLPRGETRPRLREVTYATTASPDTISIVGYAVSGKVAVKLLQAQAPDAAAWWRENVPDVNEADYQFLFPAESCVKVG